MVEEHLKVLKKIFLDPKDEHLKILIELMLQVKMYLDLSGMRMIKRHELDIILMEL
jgi:hypothetical protein